MQPAALPLRWQPRSPRIPSPIAEIAAGAAFANRPRQPITESTSFSTSHRRERKREFGPGALQRPGGYSPAVRFDDVLTNCQSQSRTGDAFAFRRAIELVEY